MNDFKNLIHWLSISIKIQITKSRVGIPYSWLFLEKKQTDAFRTTEYIDGFQYKTETGIAGGTIGLQFFATSEGYFDFVNNPRFRTTVSCGI